MEFLGSDSNNHNYGRRKSLTRECTREEENMRLACRLSGAAIIALLLCPAFLFAAGTTFTDISQPGSELYNSDFSAGVAILDVNNDGFDDVVVTNYSMNPDRLYLSNGDGTFTEVGATSGIATGIKTLGIATADIDASGYLDVLVFAEHDRYNPNPDPGMLYTNNGDGTFSDAGISIFNTLAGYEGYACAFADIDRDGLLDVFYGGKMYRQQSPMLFVDVSDEVGLASAPFVAHASFADIDDDGDADLFIARQGSITALYINDGGGNFTEDSNRFNEPLPFGLAGSWADVDNDGDLDLFISYANRLYLNNGNGYFTYSSSTHTSTRYTRGSILADFDNDGDMDLVLANEDGSSTYHENDGSGAFSDVTVEVGMDNGQAKAGGVAIGDIDGDGDLDLYIAKTDYLINPCFRNNLNTNNSVEIIPRGTVSNFSGIGTRVSVFEHGHLGDVSYQLGMLELTSTTGFDAGTTGRLHFGIADNELVDIRLRFPSGIVVDTTGVSAGSRLTITESGETANYLIVSPGIINAEFNLGDPVSQYTVSVSDGKGEGASWAAETSDSWLSVDPNVGTTPDQLTIGVDPTGLGMGTYEGLVTISADGVINPTVKVRIKMSIFNRFLVNSEEELGLGDFDFSMSGAFFDYNEDGFDDIFVNSINGQCRLYTSNGMQFSENAVPAGVSSAEHNLGVFGGDLNDDDLPDLLVFTEDKTVGYTYLNQGDGTFSDAMINQFSIADGYRGYVANAADVDNDGFLDVFYGAKLFHNDGAFNFVDITVDAGLSSLPFTGMVALADIDNDGDLDLAASRQNGANTMLYRNDGTGHFMDISANSSVGLLPSAVGISFGDVDNDGDQDMYIAAGFTRPNYLFLNDGSGYFTDFTAESETGSTNYSRGSNFLDIDNDGDLDLIVANENTNAQLFINDGAGHFTDASETSGIDDGRGKAGSAMAGDFDRDGDLDVYITRTDNILNSFFVNETDNGKAINVKLFGTTSNRAAIGSKLYLYPAGQLGNQDALFAYREYIISTGFHASGINRVHFGTGDGDLFDLRVIFPSGIVVEETGIAPGTDLVLYESGVRPDYLVTVPGSFTHDFQEGDSPVTFDLTVRNNAGNPIPWTASVPDPWVTLSASSGMTDQTVTVTVDPSSLSEGSYNTAITVAADDAINSPRTIPVTISVDAIQPVLALSTTDLYFSAEQSGADPFEQYFSVRNVGEGTLSWTLATSGEPWLAVSPSSGTAPRDVRVDCYTEGLMPGLYSATVTVTAPGAADSPATLTVHLEIIPGEMPPADTVRVASATALPGDQIVIPVTLHNIRKAAAFTIPLKFDPAVLHCDSVSFVDTRIESYSIKDAPIDNDEGTILLGMIAFYDPSLEVGTGIVGYLHMTVSAEAQEQVTTIDTSYIPPAGEFIIVDEAAEDFVPEFVKGNVFVSLEYYGDANSSGSVDISDAVYLVDFIFRDRRAPNPYEAGDANADTYVNVGDVVRIINYIFKGGPGPGLAKPVVPQPVYYTFDRVQDGEVTELQLVLDNPTELGAVQFDLIDGARFVTITDCYPGDLAKSVPVQYGRVSGGLRVGLVDISGLSRIASGQGQALVVRFTGPPDTRSANLHVFDSEGREVELREGKRETAEQLPDSYMLDQNFPNPFNPTTTIRYALPEAGHVSLRVYNILGQTVKSLVSEAQTAGWHEIIWDGTGERGKTVASGIYFYEIKSGKFEKSKKMLLLK
jgi:hypothetical protein